jgi:transcriptional regulator
MNRRRLLASLPFAGLSAHAQTPAPTADPSGSLYIPKPHVVDDRRFLHDFMDEFAFVDLVTAAPAVRITHIPVWLDRDAGRFGTIHGHISRQNPQSKLFDGRQHGVIVFRGPHGYISPAWYANSKGDVVPTWNFAVVHATGKLRAVTDRKQLHDLLARLISKFENYEGTDYDFAKISDDYKYRMMGGIVGFEMEVELLEGKFKLGQERSPADREGLLTHLASAKPPRSLRDFTAGFYRRGGAA